MTDPSRSPVDPGRATLLGILLFLFIPLVLFLFVAHPAPVGGSLVAGIALMVAHRFLALPYMLATRPHKCIWCNRFFDDHRTGELAVELAQAGAAPPLELRACAAHVEPTRRFFGFLDLTRLPLRLGIGLPLGLLLGSLVAFAVGFGDRTEPATQLFRLGIGLTVQLAALGPWLGAPRERSRAAFPVHNFYLLGIRATLWIFRLVGVVWIVVGARYWLARAGL